MANAAAEPLLETVRANLDRLRGLLGEPFDLVTEIYGSAGEAGLAFLTGLADQDDIKSHLLPPLLNLLKEDIHSPAQIAPLLPETAPRYPADLGRAAADLMEGRALLFFSGADTALSFATQGWAKHEPEGTHIRTGHPRTARGFHRDPGREHRHGPALDQGLRGSARTGWRSAGAPRRAWPSCTWRTWPSPDWSRRSTAGSLPSTSTASSRAATSSNSSRTAGPASSP